MTASAHIPVMRDELVSALAPRDGATYVDGTFGGGGHSAAILDAADCAVIAIDRDPAALTRAEGLRARYGDRLTMIQGRFGDMAALLTARGAVPVDGVALDIGVSSMQIDEAERGFSFAKDGPLDMRMGEGGRTAADLVNTLGEGELADIIHDYGEERAARRIARAIVARRQERPFSRTVELAEVVRRAAGGKRGRDTIDPATRTFQALRIAVNDELGELERALDGAETVLATGGRLVVISFHSLEDRTVKQFLRARSGETPAPSRHQPAAPRPVATFVPLSRRPVTPGAAEIAFNPRARSARLRAAQRTAAPPHSAETKAAGEMKVPGHAPRAPR